MENCQSLTDSSSKGHKIRNSSSQIFHAAREVPAQNRWCLTGTPIQNSLYDFGSLLAFVGVPPFTTREQFKFWIANPILSNRVHSLRVLRTLVRATCLRRTKAVPALAEELRLSRKSEHVKFVDLSPDEREIYEFFKRRSYLLADQTSAARPQKAQQRRRKKKEISATDALKSPKSTGNIIVLISILRLICDHGAALLPRSASEAWHNRDSQAVGWAMLQTAARAAQRCLVCGRQVDDDVERFAAEVVEYLCKEHVVCGDCMPLGEDEKSATCPECLSSPASASPGNFSPSYAPSSKISALLGRVLSTIQKNKCSGSTDSPIKRYVITSKNPHHIRYYVYMCFQLTIMPMKSVVSSSRIGRAC